MNVRRRMTVAAVAVATGLAGPAVSAALPPLAQERAEMVELLDALRRQASSPGAGITFGDGHDDVTLSAGARRAFTAEPIGASDKVRVGSDTKMFVASVVLQLVAEGRLVLDEPLEARLPGALRYPAGTVPGEPAAYDGRTVTVRQLLQHTGGLGDFADLPYVLDPVHQLVAPTNEELVAHGLEPGPVFAPGTGWRYSNTGYILLGMLVEATTGRSIGTEIAERIVGPLGLANTFFAERGQRALPGEHVRGYLTGSVPLDLTNFEPAVWGAAGALVSSPDDMNTFISALLAGRVVPPAMLAEMQDDVPYLTGGYGLGLVRVPLSCGDAWGHGGFLAGYQTLSLGLPHGRHAFYTLNTSIAVHLAPPSDPVSATALLELALC